MGTGRKIGWMGLGAAILVCAVAGRARAHCQIPCGIYDDETRLASMREDIGTIEKSMQKIVELSAASPVDYNQVVRWVMNKEHHADRLREIAVEYFLMQRVAPVEEGAPGRAEYLQKVEILHRLCVLAMRSKQSTDTAHIEAMRTQVEALHGVLQRR
ncbi:MAG: superoxide dismutase [Planctomycetes bacterium]|nr:superoxide dismutase [Planctomycetota bacterium]